MTYCNHKKEADIKDLMKVAQMRSRSLAYLRLFLNFWMPATWHSRHLRWAPAHRRRGAWGARSGAWGIDLAPRTKVKESVKGVGGKVGVGGFGAERGVGGLGGVLRGSGCSVNW